MGGIPCLGIRNPRARRRRPPKYSKIIVALVIVMNIAFASVVLYIFYKTMVEPVALISAWFSFTTVELLALATIKKKETKVGETENGSDGVSTDELG